MSSEKDFSWWQQFKKKVAATKKIWKTPIVQEVVQKPKAKIPQAKIPQADPLPPKRKEKTRSDLIRYEAHEFVLGNRGRQQEAALHIFHYYTDSEFEYLKLLLKSIGDEYLLEFTGHEYVCQLFDAMVITFSAPPGFASLSDEEVDRFFRRTAQGKYKGLRKKA